MNPFFSLHPFRRVLFVPALFSVTISFIFVTPAFSHCDGLDGPVVASARLALQDGNINRVLKHWSESTAQAKVLPIRA